MAATVYDTFPLDWDDGGDIPLSDKGHERLIDEISSRLPDALVWCGDELLVELEDIESIPDSFSLHAVISEAWDVILSDEDPTLWDDEY